MVMRNTAMVTVTIVTKYKPSKLALELHPDNLGKQWLFDNALEHLYTSGCIATVEAVKD